MSPSSELFSHPDEGRRPFIFISYARADRDFVYGEIKRLESEGYCLWYDLRDIPAGHSWLQEIYRAIEKCSCFLVFATQFSIDSPNVQDEMAHSLELRKPSLFIHWEMIELDRLSEHLREWIVRTQALLSYSLSRSEYERQLKNALSEFVGAPEPLEVKQSEDLPGEPDSPPPVLTRVVYFTLITLGGVSSVFAAVVLATAFLTNPPPGDPLSRLGGFVLGSLCIGFTILVAGAAFAVRQIYLRRNHG
jgi:hypothetical protein